MAGIAAVIARAPRRLEIQLALALGLLLTGWSIAIAVWTYGRTPNMTDFAQFAEPGSWRGHGKIVYLFAPAFLQGLASLFLAIPLLPRRIQSRVHIGFIPRRWHLLLLMLFVIFSLCDTHLRSARALRSATVGKQSQLTVIGSPLALSIPGPPRSQPGSANHEFGYIQEQELGRRS